MAENKIFAHTPEEVEALINKEGIEYVSVRFTDLIGVQQHFTVPASEFIDNAFTDGMPFDGSSVQGFQAINESDMKLIPDVTTAFVDPFRKHKTLDVAFSIVDPLTDEPYSRDPRQVAGKAEAYLKSTGIADTASFAPEAEFFIFDKVRYENSMQRSFYEVDTIEAPWNSGVDTEEDGTPNIGFKNRVKKGYFPVPPCDHYQDLRDDMVANLQKVGLQLERSHHEVAGAGQQEINYRFNTLQHAGDDLMKYKYVVHETAALAGKAVTFMPKPIAGQRYRHALPPVPVEGRQAAVLRRAGLRRPVQHRPLVHRRSDQALLRSGRVHEPVAELLPPSGAGLRSSGFAGLLRP